MHRQKDRTDKMHHLLTKVTFHTTPHTAQLTVTEQNIFQSPFPTNNWATSSAAAKLLSNTTHAPRLNLAIIMNECTFSMEQSDSATVTDDYLIISTTKRFSSCMKTERECCGVCEHPTLTDNDELVSFSLFWWWGASWCALYNFCVKM